MAQAGQVTEYSVFLAVKSGPPMNLLVSKSRDLRLSIPIDVYVSIWHFCFLVMD